MFRALTLSLAAGLLAAGPALADHHEKGEMPDIKGFYKIVGGEKYGEKIPADRLKDNRVTITSERFAVVDKDQKDLYASAYKLMKAGDDAPKGVYECNLVSEIPEKGSKSPALVKVQLKEKDGKMTVEKLWIIYSLTEERPKDFKTEGKQLMFEMTPLAKPATIDGNPADEDEEQG